MRKKQAKKNTPSVRRGVFRRRRALRHHLFHPFSLLNKPNRWLTSSSVKCFIGSVSARTSAFFCHAAYASSYPFKNRNKHKGTKRTKRCLSILCSLCAFVFIFINVLKRRFYFFTKVLNTQNPIKNTVKPAANHAIKSPNRT